MEIDYGLDLSQSQKLVMSTNLVQSLKILSMTALELENEIKRQAEENPIIEIDMEDDKRKVDWEKYINNFQKDNNTDKNELAYTRDNEVDFENMIISTQNLYDYLKKQINCYKIDPNDIKICEYIIDSLDENGYLKDEKSIIENLNISKEVYDRCKKYVQSLEPNGIGGSSLQECLLIQIRNSDIKEQLLESIIKEDLNYVANKNIKFLCSKYKINKNKCIEYIEIIKSLNPKPCEKYNLKNVPYIKPDIIVQKINNKFILIENNYNDINIKINSFYQEILKDKDSDEVAKEFIKSRLDNALTLVKSIEQRKSTIMKIAHSILNSQKQFFEKGIEYIKPMKMQQLADELNLHQSTISRGVNGKYMLTPFGLFEFKYFFSKGLETKESEDMSSVSIKNFIKEIINNENKHKPLSDEKIRQLLNNRGINIARRTVAKYREELNILPSSKRKTLISK